MEMQILIMKRSLANQKSDTPKSLIFLPKLVCRKKMKKNSLKDNLKNRQRLVKKVATISFKLKSEARIPTLKRKVIQTWKLRMEKRSISLVR